MSQAKDKHVVFRVDQATLARVEALRPRFATAWHKPTLSELVRLLVLEGLEVVEKRHTAKGGSR